jgi:hypothetical protein
MRLVDPHRGAQRRLVIAARFEQLAFVFAVVVRALRPQILRRKAGRSGRAEAWFVVADVLAGRVIFGRVVFLEVAVVVDLVEQGEKRLDGVGERLAHARADFDEKRRGVRVVVGRAHDRDSRSNTSAALRMAPPITSVR